MKLWRKIAAIADHSITDICVHNKRSVRLTWTRQIRDSRRFDLMNFQRCT